jgi:hypothetical protein
MSLHNNKQTKIVQSIRHSNKSSNEEGRACHQILVELGNINGTRVVDHFDIFSPKFGRIESFKLVGNLRERRCGFFLVNKLNSIQGLEGIAEKGNTEV